jgi:hypothetical protein
LAQDLYEIPNVLMARAKAEFFIIMLIEKVKKGKCKD